MTTDTERLKANRKAYRIANAEKIRAYKKAHYIANHRDMLAYAKAYHNAHSEKLKARKKAYRIVNRDKLNAYCKAWKIANPEKVSQSQHLRRARKISGTIGDAAPMLAWEKQWRTAKLVNCYWCNSRISGKNAHMDHIQPLSKGGAHSIENLCISCQPCNNRKSAKAIEEWNRELDAPVLL
jgi:5-methylcytosine-specific restriction endonuclease McrA